MRTLLVLVTISLAACRSTPAPRPATATYTPAELTADIDRLETALREGHPALQKFRTPAEVDSIFRMLRDSASRSMSALEFWRAGTLAIAGLRDNHTSIVPNASLFEHLYRSPGRALPLELGVIGGQLFVLRSYLEPGELVEGAEVIAIDGVPASEFLDWCARFVPTDGMVALRAQRRIERDFDLTCGMASGLPAERRFDVRAPDGSARSVTIPAMRWRDRRQRAIARAPDDTLVPAPGTLTFVDDSTLAILAVRSFAKNDEFDPERFVDEAFARIHAAGVGGLVIDVRGNTGGRDTYAARLFSHIAKDTFTYYTRRVINKRRYRFLRGTDDWTLNYMSLFLPMAKQPDGRYHLRMALDKPMRPVRKPFAGDVVLLIDGNSVSTSSELASVFKTRGRGRIVGEESGSALGGGTGATVSVVLPNTQLILNVPLMSATIAQRAGQTEDVARGVMPDVPVEPSLADRLVRRDVALDSALSLARAAHTRR